jgi:hypothetical protein
MDDVDYEALLAKTTAHNLLLRGLFTRWAMETSTPRQMAHDLIRGLVDSIYEVAPPKSDFEKRIYEGALEELNDMLQMVDLRLKNLGHEK